MVKSLFGPQVSLGREPRVGLSPGKQGLEEVYYRVRYSEGGHTSPTTDVYTWDRGCTPGKRRGGHYALGVRLYLSATAAHDKGVPGPTVHLSDGFPGPALCERFTSLRLQVINWLRDSLRRNPENDDELLTYWVTDRFDISRQTAVKYIALARS